MNISCSLKRFRSLVLFLFVAALISMPIKISSAQTTTSKPTHDSEAQTPTKVVQLVWALSEKGEIDKASEFMTNCIPIPGTKEKEYACGAVALDTEPTYIYKSKQTLKKILTERIDGAEATVVAEVLLENGRKMKMLHNVYRIKGQWKISSIYPDFMK